MKHMALNSRQRSASSASNRRVREERERRARVSSVRIGDLDRAEYAARVARERKRSRRWVIALCTAIVLVAALIVGGVAVSYSPTFVIDKIEVEGSEHLTTNDMNALAAVPQGSTLFSVDTDAIERSIERDAWVEKAEVTRVLPSTLKITITEREIAAVVDVSTSEALSVQAWAIASDGMWLMAIPDQDSEIGQSISPQIYESAAQVLHITDVPYGLVPEIGAYCTDNNVNNALAIVDGMTTELADQVAIVSATDAESTLLTLDSGVEIAFGTAENIRDKELVCLEIMERNPNKVAYINVRVVDSPTWRAL